MDAATRPRYEQIAETIRKDICSGQLAPGTRIPSYRALMKQHGAAIVTVRQAIATLQSDQLIAIGIDHAFSFPVSYYDEYQLKSWPDFLRDFVAHWPTDGEDSTVQQFREGNARNGDAKAMRITDSWTSGPKSVFQFDVQGSVAKSTHAGLPLLFRLRKAFPKCLQVWPFDGWEPNPNQSVIFEVFPSLFRNRYPREDRSVDQQDAYAVCRWLKEMQKRKRLADYFQPPLDQASRRIAQREGWIFGVL